MPDIIGLIIAGIIVGPNGLNLLSGDIGFSIFGTTGLLYLMFLAGLEIDLNDLLRNRRQGAMFGLFSFIFPFILGFVVFRYFMNYDIRGALLIAIMLSSHTLVSYPIIGRLGITNHPIVTIIIAGTIIADTIVLIILGLISDSVGGDLSVVFWIRTIAFFGLFSVYIVKILPAVARWVFKYQESEGSIQYIFILVAIFCSAALAELLKIEPLIGAFFAGLSLNRLIVRTSSLMNRIVFIGNTLFIPFFLISIGMRVDLSVLFQGKEALALLVILLILAFAGKYLAAWFTRLWFKHTHSEQNMMFGLSVSRAASTIAIIIVGNRFNLVDDVILNITVLLILVTSLVSSVLTQRSGEKIAASYIEKSNDDYEEPERILIPVSNPQTIQKLLEFGIMVKDPFSKEPIYPITVVPDGKIAAEKNALNRKMMEKAIEKSSSTDHKFDLVTRIDLNVVDGMIRAIKELSVTKIIIGWHGKTTPLELIFGTILDKLLEKTDKMIMVTKMLTPSELLTKVHVICPDNIDKEKGYYGLLKTLKSISYHINSTLTLYGKETLLLKIESSFKEKKYKTRIKLEATNDSQHSIEVLNKHVTSHDIVVFICSRKSTASYNKSFENYPKIINKYFSDNNVLLIYPEQQVYKSGIFNIYDFKR